jgi:hypothetical protein
MGLKRQMTRLRLEELTSAYEYARERYIMCPHWDEMKDSLKADMDRAQMALANCRNE